MLLRLNFYLIRALFVARRQLFVLLSFIDKLQLYNQLDFLNVLFFDMFYSIQSFFYISFFEHFANVITSNKCVSFALTLLIVI